MSWIDWLIVIIPVSLVLFMGWKAGRYVRGVSDYLVAGRICGRYVLSVADVANGLAVITLVSYVELHYKTGFAMFFWSNIILPMSMMFALVGYCTYRFRETRAMSLGQFLEMRYCKSLRILASGLRTTSEMLANMICPAIAARFFIYMLGIPHRIDIFGVQVSTFGLVILVVLTLAISIIWMGGTLALVITDTIQGLICYPALVVFVIFVLTEFSWNEQIAPVMLDRVKGESFLNPYDVQGLRDFNVFALVVTVFSSILNKANWLGAGNSSAARNPHEQKMAGILGTWRTGFSAIFYLLMACMIITLLNHVDFNGKADKIRTTATARIADEIIEDKVLRDRMTEAAKNIKPHNHKIGVDKPLSQVENLDTPYLQSALMEMRARGVEKVDPALTGDARKEAEADAIAKANAKFQEFRTLFHQMQLAISSSELFPTGLLGLFVLLLVVMMILTDDSRIFSSTITLAQDVVLPFVKRKLTSKEHINMVRMVALFVGAFFFCGSFFMSQLDYIDLFMTITTSIWMGGAGPVMIFGLYSRRGTSAGAFASLFTGTFITVGSIAVQRNWAGVIYPWLDSKGWINSIGWFLETVSRPFNPWVVWKMDAIKFPINSKEIFFIAMIFSLTMYWVVSLLTCRKPFNLDKMLHRGEYADEKSIKPPAVKRSIFSRLIGITPEYTKGDRIIAYSVFGYSFVYRFIFTFLLVILWNNFSPWKPYWWNRYFLVTSLIIPGIVAAISSVWFLIGGIVDLKRLFVDLSNREALDENDNGVVNKDK
ncbi:MAG: sodium:panthothenate symporter [Lentisphaeria bacterium]|nr:sodium:panthothenate symporter [Lentisphaeria bacterium]